MIDHAMLPVTVAPASSPDAPDASAAATGYVPGVCNIGPAEIARRRRGAQVGVAAAVGLFTLLVLLDAPPPVRLLVALPVAVGASSYLQVRLKFCAGFGSRGIYNFGEVGPVTQVTDPEALAKDRRRARQIGLGGAAIGLAVGVLAAVLPV